MNFKEEYKRDFSNITADDDFKKRLANEMNSISRMQGDLTDSANVRRNVGSSKAKNLRVYATVVAAAAVVAVAIGTGRFANVFNTNINDVSIEGDNSLNVDIGIKAENPTMGAFVEVDINDILSEQWYGDAQTDEDKYAVFMELINQDALREIICSDDESFANCDVLTIADVDVLVDSLASAVLTDNSFEGTVKYYKAVLKDDITIEFQISPEGYVMLSDVDAVYKID